MKGSRCADDEGWRTHEIRWQETKSRRRRHASKDVIRIIIFILHTFSLVLSTAAQSSSPISFNPMIDYS